MVSKFFVESAEYLIHLYLIIVKNIWNEDLNNSVTLFICFCLLNVLFESWISTFQEGTNGRADGPICQSNQSSRFSSSDHRASFYWNILYGLVLCVSFYVLNWWFQVCNLWAHIFCLRDENALWSLRNIKFILNIIKRWLGLLVSVMNYFTEICLSEVYFS